MPNDPIITIPSGNHLNSLLHGGAVGGLRSHWFDFSSAPATASPSVPTRPSEPDPSRVFGYVTLLDPSTGEKHLVHDSDNPAEVHGYPNGFTLTFRAVEGNREMALRIGAAGGATLQVARRPDGTLDYFQGSSSASFAWYYDIQFNADRSESEPRIGGPAGVLQRGRTALVSYNPDQWWYVGIEAGYVAVADPNGETFFGNNRFHVMPLSPCPPFADLPDVN